MIAVFKCIHCLKDLPLEAFGHYRSKPGGRNPRCKACERDRMRQARSTPEGRRANVDAVRRFRARVAALAAQTAPPA